MQWPPVTNGMLFIIVYVFESSRLVSWHLDTLSLKAWSLARTTLLLRYLSDSCVSGWESSPSGYHDCFYLNRSHIWNSQPAFPFDIQPWSIIAHFVFSSECRVISSEVPYQKLNFLAFIFPKQASLNLLSLTSSVELGLLISNTCFSLLLFLCSLSWENYPSSIFYFIPAICPLLPHLWMESISFTQIVTLNRTKTTLWQKQTNKKTQKIHGFQQEKSPCIPREAALFRGQSSVGRLLRSTRTL